MYSTTNLNLGSKLVRLFSAIYIGAIVALFLSQFTNLILQPKSFLYLCIQYTNKLKTSIEGCNGNSNGKNNVKKPKVIKNIFSIFLVVVIVIFVNIL